MSSAVVGSMAMQKSRGQVGHQQGKQQGFAMHRFLPISAYLLLAAGSAFAAGPANLDPSAVAVGRYKVDPTHTRLQFTVSHMGFTNWYGDFSGATGTLRLDPKNIAASQLNIAIPVASVSTTNTVLDGELKSAEWFDAVRFPEIRFVSTTIVPTGARTADITGDLTFHGVTKSVVLAARFNAAGINPLSKTYTVGFDAMTTLSRSDFDVKKYVPLIGDETVLRISAAFEKQP